MQKIQVTSDSRYLQYEDGSPFFYLGDTAWELFHRLKRDEIEFYLRTRASQGFNVIQAVALAEFDGLTVPNAYGRYPLKKVGEAYDPTFPDLDGEYSYWDHVDYAIDLAGEHGMFVALLPTWGDKFNKAWGVGPVIFDADNAYTYAKWLAKRYSGRDNIIWMLGGDRPLQEPLHFEVIDAMGKAIRETCPGHLITFHPPGYQSSADFVSGKDYIDFHTIQSSHAVDGGYDSYKILQKTRAAEAKPFMDSEPRYEDHPANFTVDTAYLWDAHDVRNNLYWNLLEGACGSTYGNHCIWSFNTTADNRYFPYHWREALRHEGAETLRHAAALRTMRPFFELTAAPELVHEQDGCVNGHIAAARGNKYALLYSPLGLPIKVNLAALAQRRDEEGKNWQTAKLSWFSPRSGTYRVWQLLPCHDFAAAVPPTSGKGNDWVLVIDLL